MEFKKTSKELFLTLKVFNKIGKENIKRFIGENDNLVSSFKAVTKGIKKLTDDDYIEIGMTLFDLVMFIMENIDRCQDEIFNLLASATQKSKEELENMDDVEFVELLVEFVKSYKQLFMRALALLNINK